MCHVVSSLAAGLLLVSRQVQKLKMFSKLAKVSSVVFFVQILQLAVFPLALSQLQGIPKLMVNLKDHRGLTYHLFLLHEICNYVFLTLFERHDHAHILTE